MQVTHYADWYNLSRITEPFPATMDINDNLNDRMVSNSNIDPTIAFSIVARKYIRHKKQKCCKNAPQYGPRSIAMYVYEKFIEFST